MKNYSNTKRSMHTVAVTQQSKLALRIAFTVAIFGCSLPRILLSQLEPQIEPVTNGNYTYSDGSYQPNPLLIPGQALEYTVTGVAGLSNSVHWLGSHFDVGYSDTIGTDLSFYSHTGIGSNELATGLFVWGEGHGYEGTGARFRVGPLLIDDIYGGVGALYSEYTGTPFGQSPSGDSWAGLVWASARFSLQLSERLALTFRPFIYYLPFENKVGYGAPPGFLGLPFLYPHSYATLQYDTQWMGWDVQLFDSFGGFYRFLTLLNQNSFQAQAWSDYSPLDMAGRYGLGAFGINGAGRRYDFGIYGNDGSNNLGSANIGYDSNNLFFANIAGFRAQRQHGQLRSIVTFTRNDIWDGDFNYIGNQNQGSIWLAITQPVFTPYAAYNFVTPDDFGEVYHSSIVGVQYTPSHFFKAYAQAGYLWTTGLNPQMDTWIGEVGMFQVLGPRTNHSIQAGRRMSDQELNTRFVENYALYNVFQQLGFRASANFTVGYAERNPINPKVASEEEVLMAILNYNHLLSSRTNLMLGAGYEHVEIDLNQSDFDRWIVMAGLNHALSPTLMLQAYYQYIESYGTGGFGDYSEHVLFMGVAKKF
jgi:hypothetical protein